MLLVQKVQAQAQIRPGARTHSVDTLYGLSGSGATEGKRDDFQVRRASARNALFLAIGEAMTTKYSLVLTVTVHLLFQVKADAFCIRPPLSIINYPMPPQASNPPHLQISIRMSIRRQRKTTKLFLHLIPCTSCPK